MGAQKQVLERDRLQIAEAATKDQDIGKEAKAAVDRINGLLKFQ